MPAQAPGIIEKTRIVPAASTSEGAGVTVLRSIGTPSLRNLDPFLLLDEFSSNNPDDYIAGFPDHPHRGFCTFTYMLDGHMQHRDSLGNTGDLGPGDAQWMKAASGVIHSEMPQQESGLMHGFQLWINLPAANKMDAPEYQEYRHEDFPVVTAAGYRAKVLIGQLHDARSPIQDPQTCLSYFDITLQAGRNFAHEQAPDQQRFLYVFEGSGKIHGNNIDGHTLIALSQTDRVADFTAGNKGARVLLVSGRPVNESVVQYGPFVMNSREEIDQAMHDYQTNNFIQDRLWIKNSGRRQEQK